MLCLISMIQSIVSLLILLCCSLLMRREKENSELLMDVFVCLLLSSLLRSSLVSVVFDFNASLNDAAPLSPISFPVDEKIKGESELIMDVFCVPSFFYLHPSD